MKDKSVDSLPKIGCQEIDTVRKRPRVRTKGKMSVNERAAIATLSSKGLSKRAISTAMQRSQSSVDKALSMARATLQGNAGEYAALHLEGVRNAAAKGNVDGAQWALERIGVVARPQATENKGITVKIGIVLPGLPEKSEARDNRDVPAIIDVESDK